MTPGSLVVRADASAQIGWGHVMRCLALAQVWQDRGGDCIFAMAEPVEGLKARLIAENIHVAALSAAPGSTSDAHQVSEIARQNKARWIVVDGYNFGEEYQRNLKESGHKLLAIDDYGRSGTCVADLILDQNAGTDESFYATHTAGSKLLLGTRYAMLRREFKQWRNWKREIPPIGRKILVTMGGSDPENLTEHVLAALDLIAVENFELAVIVGAANPRISRLQAVASNSKRTIRVENDPRNIPELMAWADVAVSAAGSTCWEMCMLGLPAVITDVAENQLPIARELSTRGMTVHVPHSIATPENIAEALTQLLRDLAARTRMSTTGNKLVDGRGADRVVAALRAPTFKLRTVTEKDRRLLWRWANDPMVRRSSFSSHEISWEEHTRWFEQIIRDDACLLLMLEDGDMPVGAVRTRATTILDAQISITVSPEFRGQGLASSILDRAIEHIFVSTELERIHAFIKPDNAASSRSFERAGFVLVGGAQVNACDALHYVRERKRQIHVSSSEQIDQRHEAVPC
jgi:UDP-2,4-diacetamido-2,4,6-trideoxy-beta-L-altropyranose hydrolase